MTYHQYLQKFFPGVKVQKLSVNVGFTCPNRDGTIGRGGCAYCRNDSFTPSYCFIGDPLDVQIDKGKEFFRRKYKDMKFLVYFQSYTNTYAKDPDDLKNLYETALRCEDVVGLVIGTRPDTLEERLLDYLGKLNDYAPVFLEIGAETSSDQTLRIVNRGHTWNDVVVAVTSAAARGIHCGLHLIAGLPGEDEDQILLNVRRACSLPIDTLKLHHLQILKNTPLCSQWREGKLDVMPFELDDYLSLCRKIIKIVPEHIVIERFLSQSPPEIVEAPKWGLKNFQFMNLLKKSVR